MLERINDSNKIKLGSFIFDFADKGPLHSKLESLFNNMKDILELSEKFPKSALREFHFHSKFRSFLTKYSDKELFIYFFKYFLNLKFLLSWLLEKNPPKRIEEQSWRNDNLILREFSTTKENTKPWFQKDSIDKGHKIFSIHLMDCRFGNISYVRNINYLQRKIRRASSSYSHKELESIEKDSELCVYLLNGFYELILIKRKLLRIFYAIAQDLDLRENTDIQEILEFMEDSKATCWQDRYYFLDSGGIPKKGFIINDDSFFCDNEHNINFESNWTYPFELFLYECLFLFFENNQLLKNIRICPMCDTVFLLRSRPQKKYCSDRCRMAFHNKKDTESGKRRRYKRMKRAEGAKKSYYG